MRVLLPIFLALLLLLPTFPVLAAGLSDVQAAVAGSIAAGKMPVVVFDLDGTLFSTDQRHRFILQEWCHEIGNGRFPDTAKKLATVEDHHCTYRIEDTLQTLGVTDTAAMQSINNFWWERFFKSAYLLLDKPLPGAAAFVKSLHDAGAVIVYLTGRDVPQMLIGTRESLQRNGFPVAGAQVHLMLKPHAKEKDHAFKEAATKKIAELGEPVALFENQPRNLELLMKAFPAAIPVFVDTNFHPSDTTTLPESILRIKQY